MHELWSAASYAPRLLSLPFALAPAAILIVIAYAAVMRGAPLVRGFLLAQSIAILPYATVVMLSPSVTSPAAAEQLFRIAAGCVPMAGATVTGFQLALVGKYPRYRWVVWFLIANAACWIYVSATSDAVIDGVRWMSGFWFGRAGQWTWLALVHTLLLTAPGFAALGHAALTRPPSHERRQLRAALVANLITYSGLFDVGLIYGVDVIPLGWLVAGVGSLLVVRALVVEDLLRVRAVDSSAPLGIVHFATGALLAWVAMSLVSPQPWPFIALDLIVCFVAVRVLIATIGLVSLGGHGGEGPLDRLLDQLVGRARALTSPPAIAQLALDIIELALGVRLTVLLASQADWGWTNHAGERLDDARAPDPLLASWLAERRDALFADDPGAVPLDLRPLIAPLFTGHRARALIPVASADDLIGLIVVPTAARRLGLPALGFLLRLAERLAEALHHARLARRAAERAALARDVELAATVQGELLPPRGALTVGELTVVGSWQPATRCAGDFWTVIPLGEHAPDATAPDHRPVLVAIGDVTGHGVAAAMVTAAAIGACAACARRRGRALDLGELVAALDTAVRRVGGGGLAMTCFAAILDPAGHELRFVSCGHTAPYLCRVADASVELHALVGRGNPLGDASPAAPRVQHRALQAGDLVVWYTDGVVEAQDPGGAPFGDRRLQHLLKRLDRRRLSPVAVHDLVSRGVAAHRAGRPPDDDATLVVAQLAPGPTAEAPP
jgi:serine phosphatase RsbU (regulator of sigma subunit)